MTDIAVATVNEGAALAEQVVIKGDLSKLSELDRMRYYSEVCRSLGLNPLTRPFEYITLNGKLTLYATRGAADQLRAIRAITITSLEPRQMGDIYVVVATGRDRTGREDSALGAVPIKNVAGEALANAMMKAETKAKRRLTLSLAGLGMSDETEVDSIPGAERVDVPQLTLAERAAEKAATVKAAEIHAVQEGYAPIEPVEAESVPAFPEQAKGGPLTPREFKELLGKSSVSVEAAAELFHKTYPDKPTMASLTDEERGFLWLVISA